jgi:hypothetical protein
MTRRCADRDTVSTAVAVLGALGAACMFGISSVLMFRAAAPGPDRPRDQAGRRGVRALGRSRLWWTGASLQALSFGVQALALAFGPLSLVQPVAATDLLFALPFLARWQGRRLKRHDWTGAGLVAAGVALFLGVSPPRAGTATADAHEWTLVVTAVTLLVIVAVSAAQVVGRVARTTLLALGGAVDFGLVDALSKNFVGHLGRHGLGATLATWDPYALAVAGIAGLALSQLTFRSGSLQISLPVIDTVEPTAAVVIGTIVFHEALATSAARMTLQLAGAIVAMVGIVVLDRSSARRTSAAFLREDEPGDQIQDDAGAAEEGERDQAEPDQVHVDAGVDGESAADTPDHAIGP